MQSKVSVPSDVIASARLGRTIIGVLWNSNDLRDEVKERLLVKTPRK